jgi:hypothetical protein
MVDGCRRLHTPSVKDDIFGTSASKKTILITPWFVYTFMLLPIVTSVGKRMKALIEHRNRSKISPKSTFTAINSGHFLSGPPLALSTTAMYLIPYPPFTLTTWSRSSTPQARIVESTSTSRAARLISVAQKDKNEEHTKVKSSTQTNLIELHLLLRQ